MQGAVESGLVTGRALSQMGAVAEAYGQSQRQIHRLECDRADSERLVGVLKDTVEDYRYRHMDALDGRMGRFRDWVMDGRGIFEQGFVLGMIVGGTVMLAVCYGLVLR